MTELSPAAQAVFAAIQAEIKRSWKAEQSPPAAYNSAAAALRAAVDQVLPNSSSLDRACWSPFAGQIRSELLGIASELENHD
jgi:hypothetical protein